jgi:hypothetical protein
MTILQWSLFVALLILVMAAAYTAGQTVAFRAVEVWLRSVEAEARGAMTPANLIELPGYQAIIRRFVLKFR